MVSTITTPGGFFEATERLNEIDRQIGAISQSASEDVWGINKLEASHQQEEESKMLLSRQQESLEESLKSHNLSESQKEKISIQIREKKKKQEECKKRQEFFRKEQEALRKNWDQKQEQIKELKRIRWRLSSGASKAFDRTMGIEPSGSGFNFSEASTQGRSNFSRYNQGREDANFDESERERLQQEANMLRNAQRRARILQEEAEISEMEEEMGSGSGDMKRKTESVKLSSYSAPLIVAVFKDFIDFTIVLALPGPATVLALCASILIALLLLFPKRRYKISTNASLIIKDFSILSTAFLIEGLAFPLNILPFMTGGVVAIYFLDYAFVKVRNSKKSSQGKMKSILAGVAQKA